MPTATIYPQASPAPSLVRNPRSSYVAYKVLSLNQVDEHEMDVHVVSKANNEVHAVATLQSLEYERQGLDASSVRVQPLIITLSSNNLSYARGGDLLHWWDTLSFF